MSNQHINSFAHVVPLRFNKSAEELLQQYAKESVSYLSASQKTGFTPLTIRRWCLRYGVNLTGRLRASINDSVYQLDFKTIGLNHLNFLYRKWPTTTYVENIKTV